MNHLVLSSINQSSETKNVTEEDHICKSCRLSFMCSLNNQQSNKENNLNHANIPTADTNQYQESIRNSEQSQDDYADRNTGENNSQASNIEVNELNVDTNLRHQAIMNHEPNLNCMDFQNHEDNSDDDENQDELFDNEFLNDESNSTDVINPDGSLFRSANAHGRCIFNCRNDRLVAVSIKVRQSLLINFSFYIPKKCVWC